MYRETTIRNNQQKRLYKHNGNSQQMRCLSKKQDRIKKNLNLFMSKSDLINTKLTLSQNRKWNVGRFEVLRYNKYINIGT